MWHKQGNGEDRPDACRSIYGEAAGVRFAVLRFTGMLLADKPRGAGQSPAVFLSRSFQIFEALFKKHHELPYYYAPILNRHRPFLANFLYRKID